jgi:hypothetical protein
VATPCHMPLSLNLLTVRETLTCSEAGGLSLEGDVGDESEEFKQSVTVGKGSTCKFRGRACTHAGILRPLEGKMGRVGSSLMVTD